MAQEKKSYEELRKEAEKNLVALGYAEGLGGTLEAHNSPGETDMVKFKLALQKFVDKKENDVPKNQPLAETLLQINAIANAQVAGAKAAAGPQAAKTADVKTVPGDVKKADAVAAKSLSGDDLKQQESNAYLRVLGKTYDQFKAENALANGADLSGKGATSPEALAALKAKVTGSPEAQAFAKSMLEKDATQDRKPGLKNADLKGDDVIALQYMLKANGQDIGGFAHDGQPDLKDGIDGVLGSMTRGAAETVASPSFGKKAPEATATTNAPLTTASPQASASPAETQGSTPARPVQSPDVRAQQNAQLGLPVDGGVQTSGRSIPAEEDAMGGRQQRSNYRAPIYQKTYGNNQYREDYNGVARGVPMRPTYAQPIYNSPFEARQARQAENFELARERLYQQAALRQESRMLNGGGYYPGAPMGGQVNFRMQDHYNRASAGIGMGPNGIELRNVGVHMGHGGSRVDLGIPRMILGALGG